MITVDDLRKMKMLFRQHLDGDGWFADVHQCIEQPRLWRRVKYIRLSRSEEIIFSVDRVDLGNDLAAVAQALSSPLCLTDQEREALAAIPTEPTRYREVRDLVGLVMIDALDRKGLIMFGPNGYCRRAAS